ncbi:MAG: histidine--tRNA ligase [Lactobacillus sp.]|jgi:histidyl-tRNA synthetase|nr:histidine--tRNA ligase [Lactobacillus sp.]
MAMNANPVRGTRDFLPDEVKLRDKVQGIILDTYKQYGFERINTPIMEDIERLTQSDGGENLSLIFKILKRGQKLDLTKSDLTEDDLVDSGLRYDLTLPLSRYYANNRAKLPTPFKCIQIDKVFRAERPQKGRYREFFQCDIDIVGDDSVHAEQELIYVTTQALLNIGFKDFTVRINDRRILSDIIKCSGFKEEEIPSVSITFDKLDKVGMKGVEEELKEKGFDAAVVDKFVDLISKEDLLDLDNVGQFCADQEIVKNVQNVVRELTSLSEGRFSVIYDKSLVRGMGYYTGMVFEISAAGLNSSIAGGGRYDKMIGKFLNESVPAVGFSIGFERICEIIKDTNMVNLGEEKKLIFIFSEDQILANVVKKIEEFRKEGFIVTAQRKAKKFGKQLDMYADFGYNYMYVFGESEEPKPLSKK